MSTFDFNLIAIRAEEVNRIAVDPATVTVATYTTKVDGYGKTVRNLAVSPTSDTKSDVRVANKVSTLDETGKRLTPGNVISSKYLIASYDNTWLTKGLLVTVNSIAYKTDTVHLNTRFGGIISKTCLLMDITKRKA